jgi:capsular polysaccharide biosynthesis protein
MIGAGMTDTLAGDAVQNQVEMILGSETPRDALFEFVNQTHEADPAFSIAVFESAKACADIAHYWTYYQIALAYRNSGDTDSAFVLAEIAERMEPDGPSWHLYEIMFGYYMAHGQEDHAADVLLKQIEKSPETPIINSYEIGLLLSRTGRHLPISANFVAASSSSSASRAMEVVGGSRFVLGPMTVLGPRPLALDHVPASLDRYPITVTEIIDATVIIQDGSILVFDAAGVIYPQFCRAVIPQAVLAKHEKLRRDGIVFDEQSIPSALILKDLFTSRNVCHFLLDYMTRIDLFRLAGADIEKTSVITEVFDRPFMKDIGDAFGVRDVISCEQRASLKIGRLFVSDNCTTCFLHPAHLAAPWAISDIRSTFGATDGDAQTADTRIYLSRADASIRKISNEAEITAVLEAHGFQTIVAGDMAYRDQVALFRRATHVVSVHGAGLTNIVFCPPGARILEIFHPIGNNPTYAVLATGAGLNYTALSGKDADSDEAIWNDTTMPEEDRAHFGGLGAMNNRNIHAPVSLLHAWLDQNLD